jgi:hypothetical protein
MVSISTERVDQSLSPARHPKNDQKKNGRGLPLVQYRPAKMAVVELGALVSKVEPRRGE